MPLSGNVNHINFYPPLLSEQLPLMITLSFKCFFSLHFTCSLSPIISPPFALLSPQHNVNKVLFCPIWCGCHRSTEWQGERGCAGVCVFVLLSMSLCLLWCVFERSYTCTVRHVWPADRAHVAADSNNNHGIWLPVLLPSIIDESNIYSVTCVL